MSVGWGCGVGSGGLGCGWGKSYCVPLHLASCFFEAFVLEKNETQMTSHWARAQYLCISNNIDT